MTKENRAELYRNRHKRITGMLTNEEYETFKTIAYENKMLPTTYATHILRNAITQPKQKELAHEHQ